MTSTSSRCSQAAPSISKRVPPPSKSQARTLGPNRRTPKISHTADTGLSFTTRTNKTEISSIKSERKVGHRTTTTPRGQEKVEKLAKCDSKLTDAKKRTQKAVNTNRTGVEACSAKLQSKAVRFPLRTPTSTPRTLTHSNKICNTSTKSLAFTHSTSSTESSSVNLQARVGRPPLGQRTSSSTSKMDSTPRLQGGANNPAERKVEHVIKSISLCNVVPPGSAYKLPNPTVHKMDIKLGETNPKLQRNLKCAFYEEPKVPKITKKTVGTNTLYRESSMQTLPYLPDIKNQDDCLQHFEVHRLPNELPNDHPPELRDVEELERARKRWAYAEAFKAMLKHDREQCQVARINPNKTVLEAFEWERYTQREEEIVLYQLQRFDTLVDMFEERERKMRENSRARIAGCYEKIEAELVKKSQNIERKYKAEIRQKDLRSRNVRRTWRKENIAEAFGNPGSEHYAPQMRYGKDPSRRNYVLKKNRDFERRLDSLDQKDLHMTKLECSYAKLNAWTKQKGEMMEVERNFCTDKNLKVMYEELRNLRDEATGKRKSKPKCLSEREEKPKRKSSLYPVGSNKCVLAVTSNYDMPVQESVISVPDEDRRLTEEKARLESELNNFRLQIQIQKMKLALVHGDMKKEESEALYLAIEGFAFGWILRFLSEEWERLREMKMARHLVLQMQLHRWRREAMEAGLRQKENELRAFYQQLNVIGNEALLNMSEEFIDGIVDNDVKQHAADDAEDVIREVAREIDDDLQRWSVSFDKVWNAETTNMLCHLLKDTIYPDKKDLIRHREAELMAHCIIEGVLYPKVGRNLEAYDITTYTANELIDRIIDNDLYLMSSESSSPCTCGEKTCSCYMEDREANAIMRKLIRRAVPGRRWKTETERIVNDTLYDSLDQIFAQMARKGLFDYKSELPYLKSEASYWDLINVRGDSADYESIMGDAKSEELNVVELGRMPNVHKSQIIGELKHEEKLMMSDSDSTETELGMIKDYDVDNDAQDADLGYFGHYWLKEVVNAYDITSVADELFAKRDSSRGSSMPSQLNEILGSKSLGQPIDAATEQFVERLIRKVIRSIVPAEPEDSPSEKSVGEEIEAEMPGRDTWVPMVQPFKYSSVASSVAMVKSFRYSSESLESEYELEINQSEFDRMESDMCKCTEELEREKFVRELMKAGKVKVLPKICLDLGGSSHSFESASEYGLKIIKRDRSKSQIKVAKAKGGAMEKIRHVEEDVTIDDIDKTEPIELSVPEMMKEEKFKFKTVRVKGSEDYEEAEESEEMEESDRSDETEEAEEAENSEGP